MSWRRRLRPGLSAEHREGEGRDAGSCVSTFSLLFCHATPAALMFDYKRRANIEWPRPVTQEKTMNIVEIVELAFFGLILGLIARLLMPGKDPMGLIMTSIRGILRFFLGTFLGRTLF